MFEQIVPRQSRIKSESMDFLAYSIAHPHDEIEVVAIEEIVQEYKWMNGAWSYKQASKILKNSIGMIPSCLIVAFPHMSNSLINTSAYWLMNINKQNDLQVAFAFYNTLRLLLYSSFIFAVSSKLAITTTQTLTQPGSEGLVKKYLVQSAMVWLIHLLLVFIPVCCLNSRWMTFLGFQKEIIEGFQIISLKCLPANILDALKQFIMIFCNSQKIEEIFGALNWISFGLFGASVYFFCFYLNMGFDGWVISFTIFSATTNILFLWVYFTKTDPKTRGLCSWSELWTNFFQFLADCLNFWVSYIFEWLGWEICTIFNVLGSDKPNIAAFGSAGNAVVYVFELGNGFMIVGRTRVNALLGAGYPTAAKKVFIQSLLSQAITGLVLVLCYYLGRFYIAMSYSSNDPIEFNLIVMLIQIYCIFLVIEMQYSLVAGVCRSLGLVFFCTLVYAVVAFGGSLFTSWYLYKSGHSNSVNFFTSLYFFLSLATLTCLFRLLLLDWRSATITI